MPTKFSFDHAIIVVEDLPTAIQDFTAVGFGVLPGGVHASGLTHNALIPFEDGTYLELLAPTSGSLKQLDEASSGDYISALTKGGEGFADFALWVVDIEAGVDEVISRGIAMTDVEENGRKRPDGQALRWKGSLPKMDAVPFLIEDITPRSLRVPAAPAHANGVIGVGGVTIRTADIQNRAKLFQKLLGVEPMTTYDSTLSDEGILLFSVGQATISLVVDPAANGSRPAHLTLKSSTATPLDLSQTHGATIQLIEH